jgi:hypothetical protein
VCGNGAFAKVLTHNGFRDTLTWCALKVHSFSKNNAHSRVKQNGKNQTFCFSKINKVFDLFANFANCR